MEFNLFNKNTQVHPQKIESIFGKNFSVIVEYTKKKTFYVLDLKMNNGFLIKTFSSCKLGLNQKGEILLKAEDFYGLHEKIKLFISKDNFESDLNNAVYELTKSIQFHLLKMELDNIMKFFKENGLNAGYTKEKNGPKLEYEIFNLDDPIRRVTFYLAGGYIQYYFDDSRMEYEDIMKILLELETINYMCVVKWLKGEALV